MKGKTGNSFNQMVHPGTPAEMQLRGGVIVRKYLCLEKINRYIFYVSIFHDTNTNIVKIQIN